MTNGDTIKDILCRAKETLKNFGDETYDIDAKVLLKHCLLCDDMYLIIHSEDKIGYEKKKEYLSLVERRKSGEPIAYITGKKEFMGYDFKVGPQVLIPRPDTEILVYEAINCVRDKGYVHILDLCTGSGAIGISLAKVIPGCEVVMVDISQDALDIARENAARLGVEQRCTFIRLDVLKDLDKIGKKFHMVVSNPPYIPVDVIPDLMTDVKDFEPIIALDGGNDGLMFYKEIVSKSDCILSEGGVMLFEIGYDQADDVGNLMKDKFSDVNVISDFGGNPRVVKGRKIGE